MDFYKKRMEAKDFIYQEIYSGNSTFEQILFKVEHKYGLGKTFLKRVLEFLPLEETVEGYLYLKNRKPKEETK